jgi:hypothetical protein
MTLVVVIDPHTCKGEMVCVPPRKFGGHFDPLFQSLCLCGWTPLLENILRVPELFSRCSVRGASSSCPNGEGVEASQRLVHNKHYPRRTSRTTKTRSPPPFLANVPSSHPHTKTSENPSTKKCPDRSNHGTHGKPEHCSRSVALARGGPGSSI